MTDEEWRGAAAQSNATLEALAGDITLFRSYVTADKVYCVYEADATEVIREHGRQGGFPVDSVA